MAKPIFTILIYIILYQISVVAKSQTLPVDSLVTRSEEPSSSSNPLTAFYFLETYYCYDLSQPDNHERPVFLYNHKRTNEFNVNLALVKLTYKKEKVRGNIGFMAGNYADYNLAGEQDLIRNIYEANAGFRIGKKVWLVAGIFPSHIGVESVISFDNLTLTRSLSAENTPYYEAGAKLTLDASQKLTVTGLVLNGWQNIRENNNSKAVGAQIQYKLSDKILFNYSNILGNEKPDNATQIRFFQDIYSIASITDKIKFIGSLDFGMEEKPGGKNGSYYWWNPTILLEYKPIEKFGIAARWEKYHDKFGVIINPPSNKGLQSTGYSLNLSYAPQTNILYRLEGRVLEVREKIFKDKSGNAASINMAITTSLSFKIDGN